MLIILLIWSNSCISILLKLAILAQNMPLINYCLSLTRDGSSIGVYGVLRTISWHLRHQGKNQLWLVLASFLFHYFQIMPKLPIISFQIIKLFLKGNLFLILIGKRSLIMNLGNIIRTKNRNNNLLCKLFNWQIHIILINFDINWYVK